MVASRLRLALAALLMLGGAGSVVPLQRKNPLHTSLVGLLKEPPLPTNAQRHADKVDELWIAQPVDHFAGGHMNNQSWQMRYFRNGRFFKAGGPLFIFIGGEWEISKDFMTAGFAYDMAREHSGMLFYTEHRFYGKSWPLSSETEHLAYLTSSQALADLEHFIRVQRLTFQSSKVVLVGGSYSGSLVAWFTRLYGQDLVTAGWASSAPLMAKVNFYEYMELVRDALVQKGGEHCYNRLHNGLTSLAAQLQSDNAQELVQRLQLCPEFATESALDRSSLFFGIQNYLAWIVQAYSPSIPAFCHQLIALDEDDTEALLLWLTTSLSEPESGIDSEGPSCLASSYADVKLIFNDFTNLESGTRSWLYQSCNEFGWFITSEATFSGQVPPQYYQQLCQDIFGPSFTMKRIESGVRLINAQYNPDMEYGNIFFTHGSLDPWRALGLQSGNHVAVAPDYAHVSDLGSIDIADSLALNMIKLKVATFISRSLRGK